MLNIRRKPVPYAADRTLALEMMIEQDVLQSEEPIISDRVLQWVVGVMLSLQIAGVALIILAYLVV